MKIMSNGERYFELKDIKCDCNSTAGCDKCQTKLFNLNKDAFKNWKIITKKDVIY